MVCVLNCLYAIQMIDFMLKNTQQLNSALFNCAATFTAILTMLGEINLDQSLP